MSGFGTKNTYSFNAPSTTASKPTSGFAFAGSQSGTTGNMFQPKSGTSGNLFQSPSTTGFQPSTTGNLFQPCSEKTPFAPAPTTSTNLFQPQQPAQQSAFPGVSSTTSSTNMFQTQQPAQQPAQQSGFLMPSTTATTNMFQTQQPAEWARYSPQHHNQPTPPPFPTAAEMKSVVSPGTFSFTQPELENYLATNSVTATTPDAVELAQREKEVPMWTPNVHRDIYNILLNPYQLNSKYKGDVDAGAVLVAKQMSSFAFVDKVNLKGVGLPADWTILSHELILNAIDHMGELTANALAVLKAFEKYLETKVKKWTGVDVANLSVDFLFCFGRELAPKFDINHRLRTQQCTLSEQRLLLSAPYSQYISIEIVKRYQKWEVIG
jgi:hypothetical protein